MLWTPPEGAEGAPIDVDPILTRWLRPHQREGVQFIFECVMGLRRKEGYGTLPPSPPSTPSSQLCSVRPWESLQIHNLTKDVLESTADMDMAHIPEFLQHERRKSCHFSIEWLNIINSINLPIPDQCGASAVQGAS